MKLFIIFIFLAVAAIGIFFGFRVLRLTKRSEQLQVDRNELLRACAEKDTEIDELKKELDKYSDVEPKIALSGQEKRMILNALEMSQYKARVQDPATRYFIRQIYINLKEKIKENIKE